MGKPIGNGFPMAAVITTREIADAFAKHTRYFNTFGGNSSKSCKLTVKGNPVACTIGLTVLKVLERENLAENARRVGEYLKESLWRLQERHDSIGDVRGNGLFIGVELVLDRKTKIPFPPAYTAKIVNGLREAGVLLGSTGILSNVLKIRPPMCFSEKDADFLVTTLDTVLGECLVAVGGENAWSCTTTNV